MPQKLVLKIFGKKYKIDLVYTFDFINICFKRISMNIPSLVSNMIFMLYY